MINIASGKGSKLNRIHYEGAVSTDFYSLGGVVVSKEAKSLFENLKLTYLSFASQDFYDLYSDEQLGVDKKIEAYITSVNEEIDYSHSDLFILSDGKIRAIDKLVLHKNYPVSEPEIFNLKGLDNFLCVNEKMKKAIEIANLKGFEFIPIDEYKS
ncbi:MAG: hypothetical protein HRT69_03595 [Flavobacteriaceae bacterium]|nr:hypothetical protein [Flavobacteriaceae bacterium]